MEGSKNPPSSKREALEALLDRGLTMIHLDARKEDVSVPEYLAEEFHLRLNLSYRFGLPDLTIDDWGVQATLSFRGEGFCCRIPWTSLFAITQPGAERGWLWPGDLPQELIVAFSEQEKQPNLRALPDEDGPLEESDPTEPSAETNAPAVQRPRPHLRLVK